MDQNTITLVYIGFYNHLPGFSTNISFGFPRAKTCTLISTPSNPISMTDTNVPVVSKVSTSAPMEPMHAALTFQTHMKNPRGFNFEIQNDYKVVDTANAPFSLLIFAHGMSQLLANEQPSTHLFASHIHAFSPIYTHHYSQVPTFSHETNELCQYSTHFHSPHALLPTPSFFATPTSMYLTKSNNTI